MSVPSSNQPTPEQSLAICKSAFDQATELLRLMTQGRDKAEVERDALRAQLQAVTAWASESRELLALAALSTKACISNRTVPGGAWLGEAKALIDAFPASAPGVGAAQTRTEDE